MSSKIDFNLQQTVNGGKLLSFSYNRSLNSLVGSWNAEVYGGAFTSGGAFSLPGMTGGYITFAQEDDLGRWRLTGNDAGLALMRSTPPTQALSDGDAGDVIRDLAEYCGVSVTVGNGLTGFNVKSAVTGTTCAEAILELCMLSGYIAYIDNSGSLICTSATGSTPTLSTIFSDGTQLDLENYATHVTTIVTRRKQTLKEESGGIKTYYKGSTPNDSTKNTTSSGSFNYTDADGENVSGSWSLTIIDPLGVVRESERTIKKGDIEVTYEEAHTYDTESKTVWRGDQEFRLFAYSETGYTTTKTTDGSYEGKNGPTSFKEVVTETMSRTFDVFDAPFVEPDWDGDLNAVSEEKYSRVTVRTGGVELQAGMLPYAPEYDVKRTRKYSRVNFGRGVLCFETDLKYEKRNVGVLSGVEKNQVPIEVKGSRLALETLRVPKWVLIKSFRTMYEQYKDNGEVEVSSRTEWSDNGSAWLIANKFAESGGEETDAYQESYAKFSDASEPMEISVGSGANLSTSIWQYLELPGRQKYYTEAEDSTPIDSESWYQNGGYVPSKICPHYTPQGYKCEISDIDAIGGFSGEKCPYRGRGWQSCVRARAALEEARQNEDRPLIEPPVIGMASIASTPPCSYQREFYIDDIISESQAQSIANTVASNILSVKGSKGLRRTVVIPLDISIQPNGTIATVSHDWKGMNTTLSLRITGTVPSFAIPSSAAGVADGIADRNAGRNTRPRVGTVTSIDDTTGDVYVTVGSATYICTTRLVNIGVGDSVLMTMVAGNTMRGHITDRI
jgi:hypothetical protein